MHFQVFSDVLWTCDYFFTFSFYHLSRKYVIGQSLMNKSLAVALLPAWLDITKRSCQRVSCHKEELSESQLSCLKGIKAIKLICSPHQCLCNSWHNYLFSLCRIEQSIVYDCKTATIYDKVILQQDFHCYSIIKSAYVVETCVWTLITKLNCICGMLNPDLMTHVGMQGFPCSWVKIKKIAQHTETKSLHMLWNTPHTV